MRFLCAMLVAAGCVISLGGCSDKAADTTKNKNPNLKPEDVKKGEEGTGGAVTLPKPPDGK